MICRFCSNVHYTVLWYNLEIYTNEIYMEFSVHLYIVLVQSQSNINVNVLISHQLIINANNSETYNFAGCVWNGGRGKERSIRPVSSLLVEVIAREHVLRYRRAARSRRRGERPST